VADFSYTLNAIILPDSRCKRLWMLKHRVLGPDDTLYKILAIFSYVESLWHNWSNNLWFRKV